MMRRATSVGDAFDQIDAPDYTRDTSWLRRRDPSGELADPAVFYVHPTTERTLEHWFADPLKTETHVAADAVIAAHAHAFPGNVWAPAYRQATTRAFHQHGALGADAYDLAFTDVRRAFEAFLHEVPDGPFVLAGHSQGARHVVDLLDAIAKGEFAGGSELARRVVAAYAIGAGVRAEREAVVETFPVPSSRDQRGVLIGWNAAFAREHDASAARHIDAFSVNPISMTAWSEEHPPLEHLGGSISPFDGIRVEVSNDRGLVLVNELTALNLSDFALPGGSLHAVEIQLFARDLRADVRRRTRTWRAATQRKSTMSASIPDGSAYEDEYSRGDVPFWSGVRGQRVPVSGGQVHYVELGDPQAQPVVLIHKLGGWVADWRHVAELIADEYRVLVVDAPGHGGSVLDKEVTWAHPITESSAMLREFLLGLKLGAVHLMGSSLGGVLSTQLASEAPELVRTLSLVGVSLTGRQSLETTLENDRAVREMFTADWIPLPFPIEAGISADERVRAVEQNASRAQVGRWARASERGFGLIGIEQQLPLIKAPVFLLNGVNARYRRYEQVAQEQLADVRIETADVAGMFPHQEAPEFTAERWRAFIADASSRGAV